MNIWEKLIEVRKVVPYLQKENSSVQYSYVSSSQVLANCKSKMDELQLLLIPSVNGHKVSESIVEQYDKEGRVIKRTTTYFTELDLTMMWVNAEKPDETITCTWYGQGVDIAGEKGVGKALTYAEKYFMLKFFNIATDKDDPDSFQNRIEGDESNNKKTDTPKTTNQSKSGISDAQQKRFYAINKNSGATKEMSKLLVENMLPGRSSEGKLDWSKVTKQEYDRLCSLFESGDWKELYFKLMQQEAG